MQLDALDYEQYWRGVKGLEYLYCVPNGYQRKEQDISACKQINARNEYTV